MPSAGGGLVSWPAPSLLKHFRDCIKGAPRELYVNVLLTAGPENKDSLIVIQFCYLGSKEDGTPYLQAISSWDGERCLLNEVNEKSFLYQQDSIAQVLRGKGLFRQFTHDLYLAKLLETISRQTVVPSFFLDTLLAGRCHSRDRDTLCRHPNRLQ